jgi:hypothetical protein
MSCARRGCRKNECSRIPTCVRLSALKTPWALSKPHGSLFSDLKPAGGSIYLARCRSLRLDLFCVQLAPDRGRFRTGLLAASLSKQLPAKPFDICAAVFDSYQVHSMATHCRKRRSSAMPNKSRPKPCLVLNVTRCQLAPPVTLIGDRHEIGSKDF